MWVASDLSLTLSSSLSETLVVTLISRQPDRVWILSVDATEFGCREEEVTTDGYRLALGFWKAWLGFVDTSPKRRLIIMFFSWALRSVFKPDKWTLNSCDIKLNKQNAPTGLRYRGSHPLRHSAKRQNRTDPPVVIFKIKLDRLAGWVIFVGLDALSSRVYGTLTFEWL